MDKNSPTIHLMSSISGKWISPEEATSDAYWLNHLCQTSRLGDGLDKLFNLPDTLFLTIGSEELCSRFSNDQEEVAEKRIFNLSGNSSKAGSLSSGLFTTLGKLWCLGVKINTTTFYQHEKRQRIPLPTYPFERQSYWIENGALNQKSPTEAIPNARQSLRKEIEAKIARIWQNNLGIENIGLDDDFFALGGDSLRATQIITELMKIFQVDISLPSVFEDTTIRNMTKRINTLLYAKKAMNLSNTCAVGEEEEIVNEGI